MYAFDAFSNDKDIAQSVRNAFVKKVRSGSSLAPLSLSLVPTAFGSLTVSSPFLHAVQWRVALLCRPQLRRVHDARGGPPRLLLRGPAGGAALQDGLSALYELRCFEASVLVLVLPCVGSGGGVSRVTIR